MDSARGRDEDIAAKVAEASQMVSAGRQCRDPAQALRIAAMSLSLT